MAEIAVLRTHIVNYAKTREEMRELLTVKANVDRVLNMDEEQKKEQEKDHGQR